MKTKNISISLFAFGTLLTSSAIYAREHIDTHDFESSRPSSAEKARQKAEADRQAAERAEAERKRLAEIDAAHQKRMEEMKVAVTQSEATAEKTIRDELERLKAAWEANVQKITTKDITADIIDTIRVELESAIDEMIAAKKAGVKKAEGPKTPAREISAELQKRNYELMNGGEGSNDEKIFAEILEKQRQALVVDKNKRLVVFLDNNSKAFEMDWLGRSTRLKSALLESPAIVRLREDLKKSAQKKIDDQIRF